MRAQREEIRKREVEVEKAEEEYRTLELQRQASQQPVKAAVLTFIDDTCCSLVNAGRCSQIRMPEERRPVESTEGISRPPRATREARLHL